MGYRLSKIYTRKGDDGTTSVDGRNRLDKDAALIEAIGTIDELNSAMGMVLAFDVHHVGVKNVFLDIQNDLFNIGGELSLPEHAVMTGEKVTQLEKWLDQWNANLTPLKEFLLPGGHPPSAACHLARTICRRAERRLVTLNRENFLNPEIIRYINRLSDLLFVAARLLAKETHDPEILWKH